MQTFQGTTAAAGSAAPVKSAVVEISDDEEFAHLKDVVDEETIEQKAKQKAKELKQAQKKLAEEKAKAAALKEKVEEESSGTKEESKGEDFFFKCLLLHRYASYQYIKIKIFFS